MTFILRRLRLRLIPSVLVLTAVLAGSYIVFAERSQSSSSTSQSTLTGSETATATVSLSDFGAVGDGVSDAGPALLAALNALGTAGGGTLYVPPGNYALVTPVAKDFAGLTSTVTIQGQPSSTVLDVAGNGTGLNLTSTFVIKAGSENEALKIKNLDTFQITDIGFLGVQTVLNDALIVVSLDGVAHANIEHSEFYGLASLSSGGAIVHAQNSGLKINQTAFLGCSTNSGVTASMVQNVSWREFSITNAKFVDYGNRPDFYSKTPLAPPYSWISIGNPAALTASSSRREAFVQNVFLDEGAFIQLSSRPGFYARSWAPFEIFISRVRMNVNNLKSVGIYMDGVRRAMIERSYFGWSHNATAAMAFFRGGEVVLDQVECVAHANTIIADSSIHLTVINSIYDVLQSDPTRTLVINTTNPLDDPVQYVRQQFLDVLGRDPDAAAYFYWVGRLLSCQGTCVDQIHQALATYLAAHPPPKFEISGRVTNETGDGLPQVNLQLSGTQNVSTLTDANGNYAFSNLATSGQYTITPSKVDYDFQSRNFLETSGNQIANFTGLPSKRSLSGKISDGQNGASGVEVKLTGTTTATSTTDAVGNYSFTVPIRGDYTITPVQAYYAFTPASVQFNNLTVSQVANFQRTAVETVEFGSSSYEVAEGVPTVSVTVIRKGNTSSPVAIWYSMSDGTATQNQDFILATGLLTFAANETSKTFPVIIIDDAWVESAPETATLTLRNPEGVALGKQSQATLTIVDNNSSPDTNPIEDTTTFVRQQYGDFLGREPDSGGLTYWVDQINQCGTNQACIASRRVGVSAAFFVESEFQQTGGFVFRLFDSTIGRRPSYAEFMTDRGYLISFADLANAKQLLAEDFVSREEFREVLPEILSPAEFIDNLLGLVRLNTTVDLTSQREPLLNDYLKNGNRGRILRMVAENPQLQQAVYNRSFVLMQYFGYLRRDPDEGGFNFWLNVLNNQQQGNFRGMVCAFLTSREFQERFGPAVPRTDQECAGVQ
jgi:Calx-beta domain-containing protein/carboxypeptidase family protein/pectate lyase-like protein/SdrD B-like protein/uncharacterized protein DUF4214